MPARSSSSVFSLARPVYSAARAAVTLVLLAAGIAAAPGEQVADEQQDGRADDGGEPGGQVEEPVQGVHVEQLRGQPAPEQRADDADHAREDEAL